MAANSRLSSRGQPNGSYSRRENALEGLESVGTGIKPRRTSSGAAAASQNLTVASVASLKGEVRCACVSGRSVFTGDRNGPILQWDSNNGTCQKLLDRPLQSCALTSVDNREVWVGLADGDILAIDIAGRVARGRWHAHTGGVFCPAAGARCVWSGGADFQIRKWDLSGQPLASYSHHHNSVRCLLLAPLLTGPANGVQIWSGSSDTTVGVLYDTDLLQSNAPVPEAQILTGHTKAVISLCSAAGEIWSGCEDGTIRTWGQEDLSFQAELPAHKGAVSSLVAMGSHVWSGSGDHTVQAWHVQAKEVVFTLGDQGGYVRHMVRAGWALWVFAAEKAINIWATQSLIEAAEAERAAAQDDARMARQQLQSQGARVEQLTAQLDRCAFDMQQLKQSCEDATRAAERARDDAQRERDEAVKAREEADERARVLGVNLEECEQALRERHAAERERMEVAQREKEAMGQEIEQMRGATERTIEELERERQEGKGRARALDAEKVLVQELRQTIMDTTQNALDLAEELDKQRATINQLQSERASSNGQASQRESEWTAQIQSLQDKIAQLQEEAARQADENEMRAQELGRAHRTEVETLTARFKEESNKTVRGIDLKRAGLVAELEKRDEAIRELLKARDDLLRELDDHVPKVQGLEDEVWSTRERMREVLDESTKLKEDLAALQQRAEGMEQEFVAQNAHLGGDLAEARAKIEALAGALSQTQRETALEAETRFKGLEADWAALRADDSAQIAELQKRLEEWRRDNEAARLKIDEQHAREIADLKIQHADAMESLAKNRQGDEEIRNQNTALEVEALRQKFESDAAVQEEVHQRDLQFLQQRLTVLQMEMQRSRQEAQEALAAVAERERGLERQIRQERDSLEREWRGKEMEAKERQEGLERERQRERGGFEKERAELQAECDRLRAALDSAYRERGHSSESWQSEKLLILDQMSRAVGELEARLQELEAQKAIMYEDSQKLVAENASLRARTHDLEARGDRDREEISWAAQTRAQMEEERNDLLARNAELERQVNRLEQDMGCLSDEVSKVSGEVGRVKEELNRVNGESNGVRRERDVVGEELNRVKEELEGLAQASQVAEVEKRTVIGELGQVKEELNGVSGRLERAEWEKEMFIVELGQVREDLERANEEVYGLRTALDQADEKLVQSEATWREETGRLREEKVRLESAISAANSSLEEMGRDLEERRGHVLDFETRLQETQEELGQVVGENGKLRATLSEMQHNVEVHKTEAETHRADAERAGGDCAYLEERLRQLEEENSCLNLERAEVAEQAQVFCNDLEAHGAELARLQAVEELAGQQISELKAALDERRASVEELESRVAGLTAELQTAGASRQYQPSAEAPSCPDQASQPSQAGVRRTSELTSQNSASHFRDVHVDSMVVSKTDQRAGRGSQEWAASAELREAQLEGALEQARRDYELLLKELSAVKAERTALTSSLQQMAEELRGSRRRSGDRDELADSCNRTAIQALKKAKAALESENAALIQQMQSASKTLASVRKECAGLRMLLADKNEMVELGARDLARAQRMIKEYESDIAALKKEVASLYRELKAGRRQSASVQTDSEALMSQQLPSKEKERYLSGRGLWRER